MSLYLYSASHAGCVHAAWLACSPGLKELDRSKDVDEPNVFLHKIIQTSWSLGQYFLLCIFSIWLAQHYSSALLQGQPLNHPSFLNAIVLSLKTHPYTYIFKKYLPPSLSECLPPALRHYLPSSLSECLPPALRHYLPSSLSECLPPALRHYLPSSLSECFPPALLHYLPSSLSECFPPALRHYLPSSLSECLPTSFTNYILSINLPPAVRNIGIFSMILFSQIVIFYALQSILKFIGYLLNWSKKREPTSRNQRTLWHILCTGFIAYQVVPLWGALSPSTLLYLGCGGLHVLHTYCMPTLAEKHGNFFYFLSAAILDYCSAAILFYYPFSSSSQNIATALYLNFVVSLAISLIYFVLEPLKPTLSKPIQKQQ